MNSYLYIVTGEIPLLLNSQSIGEVVTLTREVNYQHGDSYEWRDQLLPVVDMNLWLEQNHASDKRTIGVVYYADEQSSPLFILVDSIFHLIELADKELHRFPNASERANNFFDLVYSDASTEQQAYHLRNPLPSTLIEEVSLCEI